MIARIGDGLPLAATIQDDEQVRKFWWNVTLQFEQYVILFKLVICNNNFLIISINSLYFIEIFKLNSLNN